MRKLGGLALEILMLTFVFFSSWSISQQKSYHRHHESILTASSIQEDLVLGASQSSEFLHLALTKAIPFAQIYENVYFTRKTLGTVAHGGFFVPAFIHRTLSSRIAINAP